MSRDERGISTVVDVSVFLLLVSAAVFSVVTAPADPVGATVTPERDEATVETLATTTTTVGYDLGVDDRTGEPIERVRHGTLAELLAEAAVANASVDGTPTSPYAAGFVDAVRASVTPLFDGRTQVVATWRPLPGSGLVGEVRVGPTPPAGATVHAATLSVDSGMPAARDSALAASSGGYGRVADVAARRTVDGLFPPRRTRVALRGGAADAVVVRERFASMRSTYGSETTFDAGVEPATTDLAVAVAERTERSFERRFETPRAAAESVRTARVTVVVRTWS
ncbi:hypothetical protein C2R22_04555 [Salinigranum rubrum]|uniref:Uncharacterized protein n=1 Tax=Salinigranum rubrum TaxID=755307 RepID=A0A2I8VGH8_9EURY|nr:hypothetical protein [Salinigranum rubrum]AUV81021.1 hypothetical protein C2R22_04555 [Salinigranum rubrum]